MNDKETHNFTRPTERSADSGFTISELIVVIFVISLGLSLGFTGLSALVQRERLRVAAAEASGFIESVRKAAIAHSITCIVDIQASGIISASTLGVNTSDKRCVDAIADGSTSINLRTLSNDSTLTTSPATSSLNTGNKPGFSFKGTAVKANNHEIIVSSSRTGGFSYCIMITSPLGFIREGKKESANNNCIYTYSS